MENGIKESELIMTDILKDMETVKDSWDKIQHRYSVAGAIRVRKALDDISKQKVMLRKAMIKEEKGR